MSWFKVDDGFWSHPKVLGLSAEAIALWVRAGSYSGKHLTDGYIGREVLLLLRSDETYAIELVDAGLWTKAVNGFHFHDWADYQDTREMVEKRRESWRTRQNRHRNNSPILLNEEPVHSIPFHSKGTRDTTRDTQRESRRDRFDEFWDAYPRKAGKGAAKTAFEKACSKVDADILIAAAEAYKRDPNRDQAFTAHASTWLNQERWDDEPLPSRSASQAPDLSARERRLQQQLMDGDPWQKALTQ